MKKTKLVEMQESIVSSALLSLKDLDWLEQKDVKELTALLSSRLKPRLCGMRIVESKKLGNGKFFIGFAGEKTK